MTARVGRRRGGGTEKHSGSRSAVTAVVTDGRINGVVGGGWLGWLGRGNPGEAGEGGGVRQTGFITTRKEVQRRRREGRKVSDGGTREGWERASQRTAAGRGRKGVNSSAPIFGP